MAYEMLKIPLSVISEGEKKRGAKPFSELSDRAKHLALHMASIVDTTAQRRFSLNYFRIQGFGGWRQNLDALYELTSRGFGRVESDPSSPQTEIYFLANIPALQSL